jgi:hypothetical protein
VRRNRDEFTHCTPCSSRRRSRAMPLGVANSTPSSFSYSSFRDPATCGTVSDSAFPPVPGSLRSTAPAQELTLPQHSHYPTLGEQDSLLCFSLVSSMSRTRWNHGHAVVLCMAQS